jgi:hypothetical protein
MNNARRKEIERALELAAEAAEIVNRAAEEETDYADNMPENMQEGEKCERARETAAALEEFAGYLEEAADGLRSIE